MIVAHTRKAKDDDPLNIISGTGGLTAAANTVHVMTRNRGQPKAKVFVTGHNAKEALLGLGFTDGFWEYLGDLDMDDDEAEIKGLETGREKILKALEAAEMPLTPTELANTTGLERTNVQYHLKQLVEKGEVSSPEHGKYQVKELAWL